MPLRPASPRESARCPTLTVGAAEAGFACSGAVGHRCESCGARQENKGFGLGSLGARVEDSERFLLACGSSSRPADEAGGSSSVSLGGSGGSLQNDSGGSLSRSGSAGSGGSAGSATGVSGAAGAPTTGDAGSGGSSDESGSAGAAGQAQDSSTFAGAVYVGVAADSGGVFFSSASAHFALPVEQPNCTTQTFGDCPPELLHAGKNRYAVYHCEQAAEKIIKAVLTSEKASVRCARFR